MRNVSKILGMLALGAAVGLGFAPTDWWDGGGTLCISVLLLGVECPACGLGRALMRILHFRFAESWAINPLAMVVAPLLGYLWARWMWWAWGKKNPAASEEASGQ